MWFHLARRTSDRLRTGLNQIIKEERNRKRKSMCAKAQGPVLALSGGLKKSPKGSQ